jgi:hypothetical protein
MAAPAAPTVPENDSMMDDRREDGRQERGA